MGKYLLVKTHDRVGRMADTLEYSNVAFPRARFTAELIAELKEHCASVLEEDGDVIVIKHVYIERRMIPLNIYLADATQEQVEHAVIEYGHAIKDLVAANIFPGDMLWKNFGVTRHGKVVFYDYDEIEYLTDCNFRRVPEARNEEEEMSGEVWYHVGPKDVFPETFAPFLLGNDRVREVFMRHHADLLDAAFWQGHKERILAGHVHDVFPYDESKRSRRRLRDAAGRKRRSPGPPRRWRCTHRAQDHAQRFVSGAGREPARRGVAARPGDSARPDRGPEAPVLGVAIMAGARSLCAAVERDAAAEPRLWPRVAAAPQRIPARQRRTTRPHEGAPGQRRARPRAAAVGGLGRHPALGRRDARAAAGVGESPTCSV